MSSFMDKLDLMSTAQGSGEEEEEEEEEGEGEDVDDPGKGGDATPSTPLLPKKAAKKAEKSPLDPTKPKTWWKIVIYIISAISVSFLILALLSSFFQYTPKFDRIHTINPTVEPPRDDTETRYTAAFILSGPLNPVVMLFAGMVLAYWPSRAVNSKRVVGGISTWELIIFCVAWALVFFWLILPGFWYADSQLRGKSQDLHSSINNMVNWPDEDEIPYLESFFTSPLENYVLVMNVYMIFASLIQLALIIAVYVSQKAKKFKGGDVMAIEDPTTAKSASRNIVIGLLMFCSVLIIVAILSHLVLTVLTVFTNAIGEDQTYWMTFTTSVHLSLAYFFAGWMLFFFFTNSWWSQPALTKTEFAASKLTAAVTVVVGIFVVVFGVLMLNDTINRCLDSIQNGLEGDTEIKITVCELQNQERDEYSGVWWWYLINGFVIVSAAGIAVLVSCASFFLPPDESGEGSKFKFKKSSAPYVKDSGSDTGVEVSRSFFDSHPFADNNNTVSMRKLMSHNTGSFFENLDD